MDESLEPVLIRHLGRVRAPEGLWNGIQNPSVSRSREPLIWVLAAAALVGAAVWGFHPREGNEALAIEALARGSQHLELRSDDAGQIRAWIKTTADLDVPLPAEALPSVRLVGASLVGGSIAQVAYRIGDRNATLLVSKARSGFSGDGRHRFLRSESYKGTRVSSWVMHGQLYTVACTETGNSQLACILCHAERL